MKKIMIAGGALALIAVVGIGPSLAEPADEIVDKMIAAHGGMEAWAAAPSVAFTEVWTVPGAPAFDPSNIIVEQGTRRAHHDTPATDTRLGWDGSECWSLNWKSPMPPRFMATLTYYFVSLPWVMKDPGVVLHAPETMKLWNDDTEYISIRVTYDPGTGDTSDDYYVLIIDPKTYRLQGCTYVVTYAALLPEGVTSSPEHVLVFDEFETVDGLGVPTAFTIYEEEKVYAACKLTDWSFRTAFDPQLLEMPEGAVVDRSMEKTGG